jgi:hypothetical protein
MSETTRRATHGHLDEFRFRRVVNSQLVNDTKARIQEGLQHPLPPGDRRGARGCAARPVGVARIGKNAAPSGALL